ncbi:MAG: superoxide dismutase family protein [Gemmatimonadota bacterium]|nr:superoxide dismutase family protein [Gemmatimonadota bacterium]
MRVALFAPIAFVLAGCSVLRGGGGDERPAAGERARAELSDASGRRVGEASLQETPHGVLVSADLSGLPSGTHAIHIHAVGRCEAPFESAGPHWDPGDKQHGFRNAAGPHAGDLPNIHVPEGGRLRIDLFAVGARLQGDRGLLDRDGAALVIHSFADDYASDPAGNAGTRIVCGVLRR